MSTLSPNDLPTTDARNPPTGIVSTPTCFAVVLQALSARTVAIASCNVLKLKPHRQSIHLFLQGEPSADPTPLKPGGASDGPSEMVERLQPVEPVENEPVDVGLRDGATQVTSTLGAVSAVDINGVEVAGSVGTEEPSRATPTTGTPLAETVDLDKKARVVSTDASKVDLTVGVAHATDTNAVEVAGLGVPDDPDGATPATELPLGVNSVDDTPNVSGKVDDALKESGKLH